MPSSQLNAKAWAVQAIEQSGAVVARGAVSIELREMGKTPTCGENDDEA
jgi:hypothetical protein